MKGTLFVVGTPIGNLSDFSPRAAETLSSVDFIAAEDTRVTLKLLNHFGIKKPLVSYYEHNKRERGQIILDRILSGENCALVKAVPGPSAVISALAVSGLPTGRFTFEGFLSMNKKSRREHLIDVKNEKRTMVFYEAPHKLPSTLRDMLEAWGDRKIAVVREITKIHEEVIRTTLREAAERFSEESPRGEIVLVIEGAAEDTEKPATIEDAVAMAKEFLEQGMSSSEAAKKAAQISGLKKGDIYRLLLE